MESETEQPIVFEPIQQRVEAILTQYSKTPVLVVLATLLTEADRRNRIWRCHLQAEAAAVPATVIIKQVSPEGYDPSNLQSWDTNRFFNDWAGAQFLSTIAPDAGHGPAFYGGDRTLGFIILEDLGEHTSLVEPLLHGDASSASMALNAFSKRLAQMHAASIGKEAHYRAIQHAISPAWAQLATKSSDILIQERAQQVTLFVEICATLGVVPSEKGKSEYQLALQHMLEPGPFRAFIHGDPCPDNLFYHASEMRLIDFEFASFGHAFRDGLYGRLPFPTCWCANAVPSAIVEAMEQIYQTELASACPEVLDKERFELEACAVTAAWAIDSMHWQLEDALREDREWGIATIRSRILTRIKVFLTTAGNAKLMPALSETCIQLLVALQHRWPEAEPLPHYPAFGRR